MIALLLSMTGSVATSERLPFTVVRVDVASQDLRLFWKDDAGRALRTFGRLSEFVLKSGKRLTFGMNAGMYQADGSPVGLLVIDGRQIAPLNLKAGSGNFYLKPNGVFLVSRAGPRVVDAADYPRFSKGVRHATQSGPLLVRNGQIHPAFRPDSRSRLIRNGVCASGKTALFVISEKPVNFYEFAAFFRGELHCRDALYLDGTVSSLYSTSLHRNDDHAELGPMLGVVD